MGREKAAAAASSTLLPWCREPSSGCRAAAVCSQILQLMLPPNRREAAGPHNEKGQPGITPSPGQKQSSKPQAKHRQGINAPRFNFTSRGHYLKLGLREPQAHGLANRTACSLLGLAFNKEHLRKGSGQELELSLLQTQDDNKEGNDSCLRAGYPGTLPDRS